MSDIVKMIGGVFDQVAFRISDPLPHCIRVSYLTPQWWPVEFLPDPTFLYVRVGADRLYISTDMLGVDAPALIKSSRPTCAVAFNAPDMAYSVVRF